jgi:uncharacterized protein
MPTLLAAIENVVDFEREETSDWAPFEGADGAFHDSAGARVSLLSAGTIGSWDRRRFRPKARMKTRWSDRASRSAARCSMSGCESGGVL